jgi:tRNA(Arg) A34 adenosine deaminase TadA
MMVWQRLLRLLLFGAALVQARPLPAKAAWRGEGTPPVGFDPEPFMQRAIALALASSAAPFGAVIVNTSSVPPAIVAEGSNNSTRDAVLHAEIVAITNLANRYGRVDGRDLALITTAESCPMCMSASIWSGFG